MSSAQLLRLLLPEIAAWGEEALAPDHPYRRIGDVFYPELYPLYIEDFAVIPAPAELTPVDLAFVLAFQHQERLSFEVAALCVGSYRLEIRPARTVQPSWLHQR